MDWVEKSNKGGFLNGIPEGNWVLGEDEFIFHQILTQYFYRQRLIL